MKVVSLFDGISCGRVALERANIAVEKYVAYEIEKHAIAISKYNYPGIQHEGDVTKADFTEYKATDLLLGGSPCQSLSIARAATRKNLAGTSKLFFEFVRAKNEMRPKYFLFENVASMTEESKEIISECLGVQPILIDSADFSAQNRQRYYWTNIDVSPERKENGIVLNDILETDVDEKYFYNCGFDFYGLDKTVCAKLHLKGIDVVKRVNSPLYKGPTLTTCSGGHMQKKVFQNGRCRKLTPTEYERLQTLKSGYTLHGNYDGKIKKVADTSRWTALGNGWTVDVIAHILSYLPDEYKTRNV